MLRYADELRDAAPFFEDVPNEKPDKEMIDLAVELIERKSGTFEPEAFENHYHTALKELVDKDAAPRGKVVNLMAALRKSISDAPAKPRVRTGKPAERRQSTGRAKR